MSRKHVFIEKHRKSLGMTQGQYAEAYGVSQGLVSAIERGDRFAPKKMAVDVVLAFRDSGQEIALGDLNPTFAGLVPQLREAS